MHSVTHTHARASVLRPYYFSYPYYCCSFFSRFLFDWFIFCPHFNLQVSSHTPHFCWSPIPSPFPVPHRVHRIFIHQHISRWKQTFRVLLFFFFFFYVFRRFKLCAHNASSPFFALPFVRWLGSTVSHEIIPFPFKIVLMRKITQFLWKRRWPKCRRMEKSWIKSVCQFILYEWHW